MQITMSPISPKDREPIMDIFNYYVEHSFAAYPEKKLPYEFFDTFLRMCEGYPSATVRDEAGKVAGFGMLRPYSPIPAFSKTAEITYFLEPMCTGRGIGTIILDHLIVRGGGEKV